MLFGLLIASAVLGVIYIICSLTSRIYFHYKVGAFISHHVHTDQLQSRRRSPESVSTITTSHLNSLIENLLPRRKPTVLKPSSFGVYLGDLAVPPTTAQLKLLERSDLTILNPFRSGVHAALCGREEKDGDGRHWIARIDLASLLVTQSCPDQLVTGVADIILRSLSQSNFTGIVLAGWEKRLPPGHISAISNFISVAGCLVYLETRPPHFIPDVHILQEESISGLVIRNAAILPDGHHRDYFDLEKLQPTLRACVRESCLRDFSVLAWETINDEVTLSNAVLKRAFQWCDFYSITPWIGSKGSLINAEINSPAIEPLGAFGWLKEENVMKAHSAWRSNLTVVTSCNRDAIDAWVQIAHIIPETTWLLHSWRKPPKSLKEDVSALDRSGSSISIPTLAERNILSGIMVDNDYLGCVPLGVEVTPLAFAEVLQTQIRLRNLGLLHPVDQQRITNLGVLFRKYHERHLSKNDNTTADVLEAVKELSALAMNGHLKIHLGLGPGFTHGSSARFWAVGLVDVDKDGEELFISRDASGLACTVLHVFLSNHGVPRNTCFQMEVDFAEWSSDVHQRSGLSRRMTQDINLLSPEERILLLQQLIAFESKGGVAQGIQDYVRRQLIDAPTQELLDELDSFRYLEGHVTGEQLIHARFAWYDEAGAPCPEVKPAVDFFEAVGDKLLWMLQARRDQDLTVFNNALQAILSPDSIDAYADILGLAAFCAARKAAFDEVYLEVTDRNPLFSEQSDQAAVFAESFALGSRCEAYFDVSPSAFGKLLSARFRAQYAEKQPPLWNNGAPEFATAYGGAQLDVDHQGQPKPLPQYQRFTFLSVFAIPALVDIALLTTIGRGLYLSAWMTLDEQRSATIALMIALLLSGATGTWIAVGGSYYLVSMAFSAMNIFVLSRLIAGLAFTIAGALVGFFIFVGVSGIVPGVVFFLYLIAFTSYLTLFAAIASFQFPGSSFLSGRKDIIMCLPILLISPVITIWAGHDVCVYLAVIYTLIGVLVLALRRIGSRWVTWYQNLKQTDDTEIRKWYTMTKVAGDAKILASMSDPAGLKASREALLRDVRAELARPAFQKPTEDQLVAGLAKDYEATNFLLDWYCRYTDIPRPIPYSSGWNIQTKVALQTLMDLQKGIRLHNAFMHWRQAGDEVGCGVLYFLIALMDKWVELLVGVRLVGLSSSLNDQFRMAIGFSLAYYLIGAVLIDVKAQELHGAVDISAPEGIRTAKELREHQKRHIRLRRTMYSRTLFRFFTWHCWALALTITLTWLFQASFGGTIMYLAYVTSYTGLLWYQYTKIFAGKYALKPLLAAVGVGLPLGIILKKVVPDFHYSGVIALGATTWTAAVLCLREAKIGMPEKPLQQVETADTFSAFVKPWSDPEWSEAELKAVFDKLKSLPEDQCHHINPNEHPGSEVMSLLSNIRLSSASEAAFPDNVDIVEVAARALQSGQIEIILTNLRNMTNGLRAISCRNINKTQMIIGVRKASDGTFNMHDNCQIMAELLVHEVAESCFGIERQFALLAQHLISGGLPLTTRTMLVEEDDRETVLAWSKKELLKQHCLGIQCDINWDRLPRLMRDWLLRRATGEACQIDSLDLEKLASVLGLSGVEALHTHIARCNLSAEFATSIIELAGESRSASIPLHQVTPPPPKHADKAMLGSLKQPFSIVYHTVGFVLKYSILALVADVEWHREFNHAMQRKRKIIRVPSSFMLNYLWLYAKFTQDMALSFFLFHHRPNVQELWAEAKGMTITHKRNRIVIQNASGVFTAFRRREASGGFKLYTYKGSHKIESNSDHSMLVGINTYSASKQLIAREEYANGESTNVFEYDYDLPMKRGRNVLAKRIRAMPHTRRCVHGLRDLENVSYNSHGLVERGSYMVGGNLMHYKLSYRKNAQFPDELLRAEFQMAHLSCSVSWSAPPHRHPEKLDRWIPQTKVLKCTFLQGADIYESSWTYDHLMHPTITTTLNGQKVPTPPLIEHDWLGVLKKPSHPSFTDEDPLLNSTSWNTNPIARVLGLSKQRIRVSTSFTRSRLWKAWKSSTDLDGVVVRWIDERLVRKDKVLNRYWRLRDSGRLKEAKRFLASSADAVMASVELADDISPWTPIAIKLGDLYTFGSGGDTILHTKAKDIGKDTNETLHVLAADNGTWPNEGGGVSACRRDMINNLQTIKWHMLCESATDFGTPKHQTEQNILSLKVIPLWGLDFLTPTHGLFKNRLDSEVDMLESATTNLDIKLNFIPTLTVLVKGARAVKLSPSDLKQATRALVNLHDYFQDKRHWSEVWKSEVSKQAWQSLWLDDMPNSRPTHDWLDTELPTLGHFDTALELWLRYLFVFSIQVPDKVPAIFQASHHSVSAAYGIVCKVKRKCQLQIWDHAVAWREINMCLSSALCKLPPFVRNSLLGLMRLTSVLVLHHADTILPCADFFNPGWEVEIGTCQGTIEHRNAFKRKISPIVNGITDVEKFQPVKEITTKKPTVTMLSHLWFCKDLKTAILAADIIVNEWGFLDYQLNIYGSIEKAPTYSTECQELIAAKSLRSQVKLCGTADPLQVLEQTWLFLNSSLSEGLPLALGEAALTGAPVVCTDVGASMRVLSDPEDFSRYSAVVAPNDARALARAQIKMLAMLDEYAKHSSNPTVTGITPTLPSNPTPADVAAITQRMYDQSSPRRALGLKTREIVQKSFSGNRYLREHEQMLWIGKSRKLMQNRNYRELSDSPTDISRALQLSTSINDEVVPPSARISLRAPSLASLSSLRPRHTISEEGVLLNNSATIARSSTSRLSVRTSPGPSLGSEGTDTELSTFKLPPVRTTGLPRFPLDVPSRQMSWTKLTMPTLAALKDIEFDGKYPPIDSFGTFKNGHCGSGAATSEKSPGGFVSYEKTSLRYRNSDVSLVNLSLDVDANGRDMGILTMEPPTDAREARRGSYRNFSTSQSPGCTGSTTSSPLRSRSTGPRSPFGPFRMEGLRSSNPLRQGGVSPAGNAGLLLKGQWSPAMSPRLGPTAMGEAKAKGTGKDRDKTYFT